MRLRREQMTFDLSIAQQSQALFKCESTSPTLLAGLRTAESEYRASAFDPYWTAIEHAASHLAEGSRKTKELAASAETYYKKLAGQKHTFPAFPVHRESLPAAEPIATEFCRVVRLGQTNSNSQISGNIEEHEKS